jgi:hypothetical protein
MGVELRPLIQGTGGGVAERPAAPCCGQHVLLEVGVLVAGADPPVAHEVVSHTFSTGNLNWALHLDGYSTWRRRQRTECHV